jgi:hypothetical protein
MLEQHPPVEHHILLALAMSVVPRIPTHRFRTERSQIAQSIAVLLCIFDLYPQVVFMPIPLLGEIRSVLEETSLATDFDRGVQIEGELVHARAGLAHFGLDECVEP